MIRSFLKIAPAIVMVLGLGLSSCEEEVFDAPSFELSNSTGMTVAGKEVTTKLSITSPGGAKEIVVLKNGVPMPSVSMNGEKTAEYDFVYKIGRASCRERV